MFDNGFIDSFYARTLRFDRSCDNLVLWLTSKLVLFGYYISSHLASCVWFHGLPPTLLMQVT